MSAKMIELAQRVESASGPDRELDGEIDRLLNKRPANGDYDDGEQSIWRIDNGWSGLLVRGDGFARGSFCAADYTASIDAAVKLVPEGWHWSLYDTNGLDKANAQVEPPEFSSAPYNADGATPALALCAAALRARTEADHEG